MQNHSLYHNSCAGKMFCALTLPVEGRISEALPGSSVEWGVRETRAVKTQGSEMLETAREKEAFSWSVSLCSGSIPCSLDIQQK